MQPAIALSPAELALLRASVDWTQKLYDQGTAISGPVRIVVRSLSPPGPSLSGGPAPWPLMQPISDFAMTNDVLYMKQVWETSFVIDEPAADALRSLRTQQAAGAFNTWWKGLPVTVSVPVSETPDGPIYSLGVSDIVPYENDHGQLEIFQNVLGAAGPF